jgi:hypothetical protein
MPVSRFRISAVSTDVAFGYIEVRLVKALAHLAQHDLKDLLDVDRVACRAKDQWCLHRFREALRLFAPTPQSGHQFLPHQAAVQRERLGGDGGAYLPGDLFLLVVREPNKLVILCADQKGNRSL